ncbi:MAG: hypothetical protein WC069_06470 [Candidatus Shapirobacteria bacterium]|nr:hypothetical protein [Terrimicrobiaceae bacterium]
MSIQTAGFNFSPAAPAAARFVVGDNRQPLQFVDGNSLGGGDTGVNTWAAGEIARRKSIQDGLADVGAAALSIYKDQRDLKLEQLRYDEKKASEQEKFKFEKEKFYAGRQPKPLSALDVARMEQIKAETATLGQNPFAENTVEAPEDFEPEKPLSLLNATKVKAYTPDMLSSETPVKLTDIRLPELQNEALMPGASSGPLMEISPDASLASVKTVSPKAPQRKITWTELSPGIYEGTLPTGKTFYARRNPKSPAGWDPIPGIQEKASDTTAKKADNGKILLDTQLKSIIQIDGAGVTLDSIEQKLKDVETRGPVTGAVRGVNPYDAVAQAIENQVNSLVPGLARGVFEEVGVLTDEDVKRYKRLIPNMRTDPAVAQLIIKDLREKLRASRSIALKTWEAGGYDVSGFKTGAAEITSKEDYDKLESGTPFLWQGKPGIKK